MHRSWMFVPGDSEKMLGKSESLDADALIFDLEDAVVEGRKSVAREMLREKLAAPRVGSAQRWVRINALASGQSLADLCAVMASRPDGIVLPKAEHGAQAEQVHRYLEVLEQEHDIPIGSTGLALIAFESPAAVVNQASYLDMNRRVRAMSWGAEDLAADLGAASSREDDGRYSAASRHTRTVCLLTAAAAQVQAVDTAFTDFRDDQGLALSCQQARRDGFTGKLAIHPAQLAIINASFTPSTEELEHARAVIAAFAAQPDAGSVGLDGKMLDRPHLRQAERVLALADRNAALAN